MVCVDATTGCMCCHLTLVNTANLMCIGAGAVGMYSYFSLMNTAEYSADVVGMYYHLSFMNAIHYLIMMCTGTGAVGMHCYLPLINAADYGLCWC
jgi:hypothetical protein